MLCLSVMRIAILLILGSLALTACSGGGGRGKLTNYSRTDSGYEDEPVNEIEQAMPVVMVVPSDNLLEKYGAIRRVSSSDGSSDVVRDYLAYLLSNDNNKAVISVIQDCFVQYGYPLTDLEQSLKSINNQEMVDGADGFHRDAKTMLLTSVAPDIILELDYDYKLDLNSRDLSQKLSYTLSAIDAYTNKVFTTKTQAGISGESLRSAFKKSFNGVMGPLSKEMQNYFGDIVFKGREISVRVCVETGSNIILSQECATGDTYSDWILDYIKVHSKKGAYKLQNNTDYEMSFVNVRINNINSDGTQYNAYDWARDLCKSFRRDCGVKVSNKTQGLGNIVISIKGI